MLKKVSIATLAILLAASPVMAVNETHSLYVNLEIALNQTTVGAVIKSISEQTGYEFSYEESLLSKELPQVVVNAKNEHIENVLKEVFKDTGISYKVINNRIFIRDENKKSYQAEPVRMEASQQKRSISGVVVDNTGEPVIGANIIIKGHTEVGTVTDVDGKFKIENVPEGATLVVSYIGFVDQTVPVTRDNVYQITLQEDSKALEEVVVIGYGVQKKVNMTGSISNVKSDDLTAIATSNLSNTLAGRAPGMTITGNSGLMGASSQIRMRGGFGDPLFVIDGVIRDKEAFDALEANEVDQLSFLKDAATASVYGSAAGNGVVLVVTKSGNTNSKPVFNYQGSYTFSKPTKELFSDMFTATDELIYQNKVAEFKGQTLPNGEAEFDYFKDKSYNVNDWIWQTPWNTKHSLSVAGGSEKVQYFVLGSFLGEEGSYENLSNKKYTLRSNITMELSKYIKMNVNINANQSDQKRFYWPFTNDDDQAVYDLYRCTFNALKTVPFYSHLDGTPASKKTDYPIYPAIGSWQSWNVVDQVIGDRYIKTRKRNMSAILTFDVDLGFLLPGLSTKIMGNYIGKDYSRKKFMTYQTNYKFQQADPNGNRFLPGPLNLNDYNTFTFSQNYENLVYGMRTLWSEQFNWFLNYNQKFGKHDVGAMVVFEQAENGGEYVEAKGESPLTNYDQMFVYSTDAERRYGNAIEYTGGRLSWIGRFNYNYDSKYIAEFSFRYDGNDLFAPGNRWGFFPSVSAAWRISAEPFMEGTSNWLSDLKIRASYGTTGNDLDVKGAEIANFSYIKKYVAGLNYIYGKNLANGIKPGATPSVNLTWATSTTYNGGIDYSFLNNRLSGSIDGFYRKETDILGPRTESIPSTYGQALAPENYAARSWRGGEFSMIWRDGAAGGEIDYSAYVNLGFSRDKWDILDESAVYKTGNLSDLTRVGKSNNPLIGLKAIGIIRTQEQVDELKAKGFKQYGRDPYLGGILYEDTRGDGYSPGPDGKIDGNDAYNLLSEDTSPRINYGFGGSIKYKGITLDLHFQGVGKYDRIAGGADGGFYQHGGSTRPYFPIWTSDDCWSLENPNGKYPRVIGSSWYESGVGRTSFWLRNGAYLRLKNVNIGYDLPQSILRPIGISKAQIFANGTNLFFISAMGEFMDPEQEHYDSYPLMKSFTFGLNFTF
ncbi:SusC/RagA family TonB-linked outer membrane protein [Parabacteroides sp. 52]|uniref:TonB-dependent receptor n=1 Tax=unclassified Parabacteroides TaxID=2649774 RepID=UPI0013D202AC|nr:MULTISPECIES: TonB-dependent receptor [unclassified Parabacteroides]MDH6533697.1 TonB-linked SusC/RagA family outer membrane protein [Parabacteroides sp. PM5-20]NDV54449.1 SusC/RagA family TonB-linked outer membrane protein [Parabacteroides sp. 52]